MSANLTFFLIFLLTTFIFALHAFFILYHLIRFGIGTRPKQAALVFFIGSGFLFIFLSVAFLNIDANQILMENTQNLKDNMKGCCNK